jgi:hypothetical protein
MIRSHPRTHWPPQHVCTNTRAVPASSHSKCWTPPIIHSTYGGEVLKTVNCTHRHDDSDVTSSRIFTHSRINLHRSYVTALPQLLCNEIPLIRRLKWKSHLYVGMEVVLHSFLAFALRPILNSPQSIWTLQRKVNPSIF